MCGRLNLTDSAAVIDLMKAMGFQVHHLLPRFYEPQFNVAPTDPLLVAGVDDTGPFLRAMTWWLTPSWAPAVSRQYSMFNARSESLEVSRAFKGPFRHRRCLIPASGFIEWRTLEGVKRPYYIKPASGFCFFAGLWDVWEKEGHLESCTMITTEASEEFRHIHTRMPAILSPAEFDQWLDASVARQDLKALLQPRSLSGWQVVPLAISVNSSRNKSEDAISPVGPVEYL